MVANRLNLHFILITHLYIGFSSSPIFAFAFKSPTLSCPIIEGASDMY